MPISIFDEATEATPLHAQTAFNLPELSLQFNGTLKVGTAFVLAVVHKNISVLAKMRIAITF